MSDIVPIRNGVEPVFDAERELIDYCTLKVREFTMEIEAPPTRVVLCLMGNSGEHNQSFTTNCWDSLDTRTESEMCGHAIGLLAKKMTK